MSESPFNRRLKRLHALMSTKFNETDNNRRQNVLFETFFLSVFHYMPTFDNSVYHKYDRKKIKYVRINVSRSKQYALKLSGKYQLERLYNCCRDRGELSVPVLT